MRLGQLARKLGIRPGDIVEFLGANQIRIDEGSNTRLTDEHAALVTAKFAPQQEDKLPEESTSTPVIQDEAVGTEPEHPENEIRENASTDSELTQGSEPVELIKAPKIALSGLKVLGKIDLPEQKKAAAASESTVSDLTDRKDASESRTVRKTGNSRSQRRQAPRKNPIALERAREAEALKKKREEQAEREKLRKTQNYLKKVKLSPPTKSMKIVNEPLMQMTPEELRERPTTWLGKFLEWLTHA